VTKGAVGAVKLAVYLAYPLVILISSKYPLNGINKSNPLEPIIGLLALTR
jgi:hypothetical protein